MLYEFPHLRSWNRHIHRDWKSNGRGQGLGEGERGVRVSVWEDDNILETGGGEGHAAMWVLHATEPCAYRGFVVSMT